MTLAISDTEITPIDLQKIQSGDPSAFQQLYRKFYMALVSEATSLLNHSGQAIALVQLGCIQAWTNCQNITSDQYYFGYVRSRILRYSLALKDKESSIYHELGILNEILAQRYLLSRYHLAKLYEALSVSQRALVRQLFRSYYQSGSGELLNPKTGHQAIKPQSLLHYSFCTLHFILAHSD